jgi:NAD(P)H-nitrite reductase large subunit
MTSAVVNPQQLAMIAQVLEAYAIAFSITDPTKRESLGELLLALVQRGANSTERLALALDDEIAKGCLR